MRRRRVRKGRLAIVIMLLISLVSGGIWGGYRYYQKKEKLRIEEETRQRIAQKKQEVDAMIQSNQIPNDEITQQLLIYAQDDERVYDILKQYAIYPNGLLDLYSRNEDMTNFIFQYTQKKDQPVAANIGEITQDSIPLLLQYDERWGYGPYGDNILAVTGCGPVTIAMVASGLLQDPSITPTKVAQYAMDNGYFITGAGSSWELMKEGAKAFGIQSKEIPLSKAHILKSLEEKKPVIASMLPGDFTRSGHFIVIVKEQDGKFVVNDPNSKKRSSMLWDYETLAKQINNLWSFEAIANE